MPPNWRILAALEAGLSARAFSIWTQDIERNEAILMTELIGGLWLEMEYDRICTAKLGDEINPQPSA